MENVARSRVFIGSSSESLDVAKDVARCLEGLSFDVLGWWESDAFPNGSMFLGRVLSLPHEVEFAMFVFGGDDRTESRQQTAEVTRDNVVLEYGAFSSVLGLERTAVLAREDVRLPSDQAGLSVSRYSATPAIRQDALGTTINAVAKKWRELEIAAHSTVSAYPETLAEAQQRVERLRRRLENPAGDVRDPVELDSQSDAIAAYCEGLDSVQERFWTTTFLTSPFWTRDREVNEKIMAANEAMIERLVEAVPSERQPIRRLFLLEADPDEYVQRRLEERIQLRRQDNGRELEAQNGRLRKLRRNMERLKEQGVSTRVVFDSDEVFSDLLGLGVLTDPMDTEIAIYDNVRVDGFDGGSVAAMTALRSYSSEVIGDFDRVLLKKAEQYFDDLWTQAQEVEDLLDGLDNARLKARSSIDYQSNWLARYEFALADEDKDLKAVELGRTEEMLLDHFGDRRIDSYLDVGTCTGRYPLEFRTHVADDGVIVAVDDDTDCFVFAQQKDRLQQEMARQSGEDLAPAIEWERRDVTSPTFDIGGPFDIITCMLGTLSHFGYRREPEPFEDVLQGVLERLHGLLASDGLLVIGSWSEFALAERQLLGIYSDDDLARLVRWTPDREELRTRLGRLGFHHEVVQQKQRLDLWKCTKDKPGSTSPGGDGPAPPE